MVALFPLSAQRKTKVRVLPRFPARVEEGAGIDVARSAGVYTFSLEFSSLTPIASLADDDKFAVERADGSFAYINAGDMAFGGGGSGDMLAATYDPQNIADDAFDRANHTGTQLLATISDAGDLAALDIVGIADIDATGTPDNTTFLRGDGAWSVPAGSGDVSKVGTPVDGQIGVWTGDGTIEGDSALTFDTSTDSLVIAASGNLLFGAVTILDDAAGTMTLSNVDALDATTEATIEAAIDTLANLTSIQGVAFTFGAYAATLLNNANEAAFKAAVNLEIGVDVQAYDADLTTWAGLTPSANHQTLVTQTFAQMRASLDLEAGTDFYSITAADAAFQAKDADLTSWAGVTRATGFDTFVATPSLANLGSLLTDEASGLITFMTTPSSANLRALLTDETGTGVAYFAGGNAGTPSAITLTNGTGLPVSGITSSTSTALGVGTLELGHASDTTLSRSAAGKLDVEGHTVLTDDEEDQTLSGGARIAVKDLGNLSGTTITPDPGDRPIQKITNNGAGTIAPGANVGCYLLVVKNTTGAGAITTSGWQDVSGESFDTTTTSEFLCHCTITGDLSAMVVNKVA